MITFWHSTSHKQGRKCFAATIQWDCHESFVACNLSRRWVVKFPKRHCQMSQSFHIINMLCSGISRNTATVVQLLLHRKNRKVQYSFIYFRLQIQYISDRSKAVILLIAIDRPLPVCRRILVPFVWDSLVLSSWFPLVLFYLIPS